MGEVISVDDIRLLRFRWEDKEYGVPVEDVIGITQWTWVNGLAVSGLGSCKKMKKKVMKLIKRRN